jgi:uncharacterized protein involved in response to NO
MDSTSAYLTRQQSKLPPLQQPFERARPWLVASCALGLGAGFLLAAVLSATQALDMPLGLWWAALVQAHGHIQLFGWAGLLVLGVALHFLPRLRAAPLAYPRMVPWLLALLVTGLVLRVVSQPLLALTGGSAFVWRMLLAWAGLAELVGGSGIVGLLFLTLARRNSQPKRPELQAFLFPIITGLFCFWLALALNAAEGIRLLVMGQVLLAEPMDLTVVQLGLFGFLVPVALGMAARVLPLYLGLRPLTARPLWLIFCSYEAGLALNLVALWIDWVAGPAVRLQGIALALMGGALLTFVTVQGILLPLHQTRLVIPAVQTKHGPLPARPYPVARGNDPAVYGPVRWLMRSAFAWLTLLALAGCVDGVMEVAWGSAAITADALLHATTVGVVMLLIFGIGQRMLPGFSGSKLASPHLVTATLWLGNGAAILRVVPVMVGPWLSSSAGLPTGIMLWLSGAFGFSGPLALAAMLCFTVNLASTLHRGQRS